MEGEECPLARRGVATCGACGEESFPDLPSARPGDRLYPARATTIVLPACPNVGSRFGCRPAFTETCTVSLLRFSQRSRRRRRRPRTRPRTPARSEPYRSGRNHTRNGRRRCRTRKGSCHTDPAAVRRETAAWSRPLPAPITQG